MISVITCDHSRQAYKMHNHLLTFRNCWTRKIACEGEPHAVHRLYDTLCTPIAHSVTCVRSCSVMEQCYVYVCVYVTDICRRPAGMLLIATSWHRFTDSSLHSFFFLSQKRLLSGIERSSEPCHAVSAHAVIWPIRLLALVRTCSRAQGWSTSTS